MTRLFFRFYVGILFILFAAWYVQAWVSSYNVDERNARVVVRAMAGAVRVSRDWLDTDPNNQHDIIEQIRSRFEFPVNILPIEAEHIPRYAQQQLKDYERLVLYDWNGVYVATRLAAENQVVSLGPLPQFVGPEETAQLTGLGLILVLAAAAIAVLLRPVARQLRAVERTASAIAAGDLSARIETGRVPHGHSLALAFNSMAERTQSLLRTQRELLQAVSHDLRTPLARIRFATDLVSSANTVAERRERLHSIDQAAEDLDRLVGELLNYVRMETAESIVQVTTLPAKNMVTSLVEHSRELYPELVFEVRVLDSQQIQADESGLHRVIANLLGNACRYAKSTVRVTCSETPDQVVLSVEDDGPGIPPEERDRVLNPFVRLSKGKDAASPSETGVGLGLALVSRIVERHDGSVAIGSSELGGCRVETSWPRQK